ncbi:hypothetical protein BROUX41_000011 [Berkeleyomyces rouxiae]|uniref:uncharacterized protein n=1 Tax=Berkeleyomyces rouxiae TaxID=2035830 RepID=UPI003B78FE62
MDCETEAAPFLPRDRPRQNALDRGQKMSSRHLKACLQTRIFIPVFAGTMILLSVALVLIQVSPGMSIGTAFIHSTVPVVDNPYESPRLRPMDDYIIDPTWDYSAKPTVREYFWTIADAELNPDGVFRPMILINNKFPGPLIEANIGDNLIVHINNRGTNATSIHFHGLFQNGTNSMDGTVGITQCPIAPETAYMYNFTVDGQSGTYWYHAHYAGQASDGVFGPLVIHAPNEKGELQKVQYASDRVVMVHDHYHDTSFLLLMEYLASGNENQEPVPESALINGHGVWT